MVNALAKLQTPTDVRSSLAPLLPMMDGIYFAIYNSLNILCYPNLSKNEIEEKMNIMEMYIIHSATRAEL